MSARPIPAIVWLLILLLSQSSVAQRPPESQNPLHPFTIRTDVNVVLVPVLVRDLQGREVGDLQLENFQVFDNGKPQVVSRVTLQQRTRPVVGIDPSLGPSGQTPAGQALERAAKPDAKPDRFIVLLFDDLHLTASDLLRSQDAVTRMLAAPMAESDRVAVASLSGLVNSGLTRDPSELHAALVKIHPQGLFHSTEAECPDIDYYHADMIENKHSSVALQAAIQQVFSCSPGLDTREVGIAERLAEAAAIRALTRGDQDIRVTLSSIREYVRKMAALPGQRTLILVSPGFLTLTRESTGAESQIIDLAAQSGVTLNALDARGLYTTELDASVHGAGSPYAMQLKQENYRNSATSSENVMAELADGSGGTYFHNSNDLQGGFRTLTAPPEFLYLLYVSPRNMKKDGSYHRLRVIVDRKDVKLQARQGYFAYKPSKNKTK